MGCRANGLVVPRIGRRRQAGDGLAAHVAQDAARKPRAARRAFAPDTSHAGHHGRALVDSDAPRRDIAGEPREQTTLGAAAGKPRRRAARAGCQAEWGRVPRRSRGEATAARQSCAPREKRSCWGRPRAGGDCAGRRGRARRHGRAPAAMAEPGQASCAAARRAAPSRGRAGHAAASCRAQGRAEPRSGEPRAGRPRRRARAARKAGVGLHGREEEGGVPRAGGAPGLRSRRGAEPPWPHHAERHAAGLGLHRAGMPREQGKGKKGRGGGGRRGAEAHHGRGEGDVDGRRRGRVRSSGRAGGEGCAGEGRMCVVGGD
eukprot:XP_020397166.1 uncharacterized protein LOC109941091 [Zea mays]